MHPYNKNNSLRSLNNNMMILPIILILSSIILFATQSRTVCAAQQFNVDIDLPSTYTQVDAGTQVWFTIKLLNLANSKRVDVTLNYELLDPDNKSVAHSGKTVAIETQASFVADLTLPADAIPGDYYVHVTVNSTMGESTAKTSFKVIAPQDHMIFYYIGIGLIVVVLIMVLMIKSRPWIAKVKMRLKIRRIVREKLRKE